VSTPSLSLRRRELATDGARARARHVRQRQHDHACLRAVGANPLQQIKPIGIRQLHIANYQLLFIRPEDAYGLSARQHPLHAIPILQERIDDPLIKIFVTFHYKNAPLLRHRYYHQEIR